MHPRGDFAEIGDVAFHPVGDGAGRAGDVVHGGDEFRHAQHQRVLERAHVRVRAGKHFLQHDVGLAQPLEQRRGVGAQHVVRFQHLGDRRGRRLLGMLDRRTGGGMQVVECPGDGGIGRLADAVRAFLQLTD